MGEGVVCLCRGEWGESVLTETILDYCSEELETRGGREPGLNAFQTLVAIFGIG